MTIFNYVLVCATQLWSLYMNADEFCGAENELMKLK